MTAISAVLIVRNEEALLARCLDSIAGVDELVVCDTGSIDSTVEIAESYGAVVTHFEWCDHFAAARNFAKGAATHDWILSIDADEQLLTGVDSVRRAIEKAGELEAVTVDLIPEGNGSRLRNTRIMRRHLDWAGAAHNHLDAPAYDGQVVFSYCTSPAHALDSDRTLRILSGIAEPTPREQYYLAREWFYRSEWARAIEVLDEYLPRSTFRAERADGWLMRARCHWQLRQGQQARACCLQAVANNPHFAEALVFMAELSWPAEAEQWLRFAELADNRGVLFVRTP